MSTVGPDVGQPIKGPSPSQTPPSADNQPKKDTIQQVSQNTLSESKGIQSNTLPLTTRRLSMPTAMESQLGTPSISAKSILSSLGKGESLTLQSEDKYLIVSRNNQGDIETTGELTEEAFQIKKTESEYIKNPITVNSLRFKNIRDEAAGPLIEEPPLPPELTESAPPPLQEELSLRATPKKKGLGEKLRAVGRAFKRVFKKPGELLSRFSPDSTNIRTELKETRTKVKKTFEQKTPPSEFKTTPQTKSPQPTPDISAIGSYKWALGQELRELSDRLKNAPPGQAEAIRREMDELWYDSLEEEFDALENGLIEGDFSPEEFEAIKRAAETDEKVFEKVILAVRDQSDLDDRIEAIRDIHKNLPIQTKEEAARRMASIYAKADELQHGKLTKEQGLEVLTLLEFFIDELTAVEEANLTEKQKSDLILAMPRDADVMIAVSQAITIDENDTQIIDNQMLQNTLEARNIANNLLKNKFFMECLELANVRTRGQILSAIERPNRSPETLKTLEALDVVRNMITPDMTSDEIRAHLENWNKST